MNFCLDARTVTNHFPGIGRYVVNLARFMAPFLGQDERLVLLRDPTQPSWWDITALAGEKVHLVDAPVSPFSLRQQWLIPRLLRHLRATLYHSPYYLMPYNPGVPTVITLYDFIPLLYPTYFSPTKRLIFRGATYLALRTANTAIVLSQAAARDLKRLFGTGALQIRVLPAAPDPCFNPRPPAEVERIRQKYSLPDEYVLYVGINKPHKNLTRLIEAWTQIRRGTLIIAGAWDPRYPQPRQRAEELGLGNSVRFLGPVPEGDLPALYTGATLFVFPSLYEGFGLPVLEAMACGTPVICSNSSSLPEVAGNAALTFDPTDVEAIAEAIAQALSDEGLRETLKERALAQVRKFSWERTAAKTLEVHRSQTSPHPLSRR